MKFSKSFMKTLLKNTKENPQGSEYVKDIFIKQELLGEKLTTQDQLGLNYIINNLSESSKQEVRKQQLMDEVMQLKPKGMQKMRQIEKTMKDISNDYQTQRADLDNFSKMKDMKGITRKTMKNMSVDEIEDIKDEMSNYIQETRTRNDRLNFVIKSKVKQIILSKQRGASKEHIEAMMNKAVQYAMKEGNMTKMEAEYFVAMMYDEVDEQDGGEFFMN